MEDKRFIVSAPIESEMKEAYVDYAMSVIVARALPDVRDGMKPVHRRILYTMFEEHITPDRKFRKSAATVGNVIARYHPHGDVAVYDAMVRLAQPFSIRYPMVWPQGNFGSLDGDPPAAMRYTEAKLSPVAMEMLRDIGKDTVVWSPNFDNSTQEPTVLPAMIPNLLVNGSEGIAVGMASRIPPHNLREVIDGCVAVIRNPDITMDELMEIIPGPDFPTGGYIVGKAGIRSAYTKGRGKILLRSVTHRETDDEGRNCIVVDEIPYMVNKARLVADAAAAINAKKIKGVCDLRDESSRKGIRIVFVLKKKADPDNVERELLENTDLETVYGAIMLALVNNVPAELTLRDMIDLFVKHRRDVVTRRTEYELRKAKARLHIVEGLLKALAHIHEIIAVIKSASNTDAARISLAAKYGFSDLQVQAILDMRLQKLTHLERGKLEEEQRSLTALVASLEELLADQTKMDEVIITELEGVKARHGDERRTRFASFTNTKASAAVDSTSAEQMGIFDSDFDTDTDDSDTDDDDSENDENDDDNEE